MYWCRLFGIEGMRITFRTPSSRISVAATPQLISKQDSEPSTLCPVGQVSQKLVIILLDVQGRGVRLSCISAHQSILRNSGINTVATQL